MAVTFLNDAYGGTPSTDCNLYVTGIDVNGQAQAGAMAARYSNGTDHFTVSNIVPTTGP